jgi:fructose-1,6-bisphosphatase/inositol monophosphatase family enzyme
MSIEDTASPDNVSSANNPEKLLSPSLQRATHLCDRLSLAPTQASVTAGRSYWLLLERALIRAVVAGGMAAMGYYRQTLPWSVELNPQDILSKNPSTIADLEATASILQTAHTYLAPISRVLGCPLIYLGEETKHRNWLRDHLSDEVFQCVHPPDSFFSDEDNSLRVIFDGIDGTGNFVRGIPLFCSAAAVIVGTQARLSAIYDPIHNIVYFATIKGSYKKPEEDCSAWSWQIGIGRRVNLLDVESNSEQNMHIKPALGVHLTRSSPEKLHDFLGDPKELGRSTLERLSHISGATYAFNSGMVAMVDVSRRSLGGFVNNTTNLWDIAAGDVLVRACGGIVTDFQGNMIDYSQLRQTSIIAAHQPFYASILDAIMVRE